MTCLSVISKAGLHIPTSDALARIPRHLTIPSSAIALLCLDASKEARVILLEDGASACLLTSFSIGLLRSDLSLQGWQDYEQKIKRDNGLSGDMEAPLFAPP